LVPGPFLCACDAQAFVQEIEPAFETAAAAVELGTVVTPTPCTVVTPILRTLVTLTLYTVVTLAALRGLLPVEIACFFPFPIRGRCWRAVLRPKRYSGGRYRQRYAKPERGERATRMSGHGIHSLVLGKRK